MTRRIRKNCHFELVSESHYNEMLKQVHHDVLQKICLICAIFFLTLPLFAEPIVDNDFGFSLDIPEGFQIEDSTPDGMSYLFSHPNIPVNLVMKITPKNDTSMSVIDGSEQTMTDTSRSKQTMTDTQRQKPSSMTDTKRSKTPLMTDTSRSKTPYSNQALSSSLQKLNAQFTTDTFIWNDETCAISNFTMQLDQKYSGWAIATQTSNENYFLVLICYAPFDKDNKYDQFIMSTLNSLCINDDFYNAPGIITTFAFPKECAKKIVLNVDAKTITTKIENSDIEAAQFVVEMEYAVLTLYANHKSWKEAWQRYYRLIYRDSYSRMQNVSQDLYNTFYESCKSKNPQNPDIVYAQTLLSWVQNFPYTRAKSAKDSDFTCLPSVILGKGSDCDSRSLLLCVLLKSVGIETLFLFSPEYSHAIVATQIDAPGQKYTLENYDKEFIFGETTAKVTWGMIAQQHSDRKKWIPVILP